MDVLKAQGITAVTVKVRAVFKAFPGFTTKDSGINVNPIPAQGSGVANYGVVEFYDHNIVKVTGIVQPNAIYDPSYGRLITGITMAEAELKREDAAIASYVYQKEDNTTGSKSWALPTADVKGVDELDFTTL